MANNITSNIGVIECNKVFNLSHPELASTNEFSDKVILDALVHHDSPMYLMVNRTDTNNSFYIHSPNLGDLEITSDTLDRLTYPVGDNLNENCIGGKLHLLENGYIAYSVYGNNFGTITRQEDTTVGSLELITGVFKANPFLGQYNGYHGVNFYGSSDDIDGFLTPFLDVKYEFSNNHTGISTDGTDVNGISTIVTYTEQYSEDIYYIHYAWVDHISSTSSRYNVLTRKIDVSGESPVISNVVFVTTAMSTGNLAYPAFYMDGNSVLHCAFYHSNSTYCQYFKLTRSRDTVDSSWSWDNDSNYITINNLSLMSNYSLGDVQSKMTQSSRRMYLVNSNGNLVEFKKSQSF